MKISREWGAGEGVGRINFPGNQKLIFKTQVRLAVGMERQPRVDGLTIHGSISPSRTRRSPMKLASLAILETFANKKKVRVIDFSMKQGMQWPTLMQALALRTSGPSSFRLTGIGRPTHDNSDHLQEMGWKLAQLADTIHVEFEYRGFVADSLADLDASVAPFVSSIRCD
ncbi:hypothetical protein RJ640_003468 [Escallonia rubra]|uniref:DELLA protein n=1 Tax=Escallonia rubra TaxID=112253 RepID=A0AA88QPQ0_9ASTE|nr:hypothetical protein RJ640_003468 [Escallonia rubra]